MTEPLNKCGSSISPAGWSCSRPNGHTGPCAVTPVVTFTLQQWEYRVIPVPPRWDNVGTDVFIPHYSEVLNSWGEDGWELICIERDHFIFKRPKA